MGPKDIKYNQIIKKIITLDASNDGLFGTSKLINQLKSEKFDKVFQNQHLLLILKYFFLN